MARVALTAGVVVGGALTGGLLAPVIGSALAGGAIVYGSSALIGGLTVGGLGASIGALGASYLGQTFIFPSMFGEQDIQGPRLDDFRLQVAAEGSPGKFCLGPENRVGATLIWLSDIIEQEAQGGGGGGKGGGSGGSQPGGYVYFVHIAAYFCEGEVSAVKKIWADSKLIYDTPDAINITTGNLWKVTKYAPGDGSGKIMQIWSKTADGGPDFEDDYSFQDGTDVTIAGFTGGMTDNNGTWKFKRVKVESRTSEVQTLTFTGSPTSGNFRLQIDLGEGDRKTGVINWDDDASEVQTAIQAHPDITTSDVECAGTLATGLTVTFKGQYKGDDVDLLTVVDNNLDDGTVGVVETTPGEKVTRLHLNTGSTTPATGTIVDTINISQTPEGFSQGKIEDVRIYLGDETQTADSLIEAWEGTGNVPGYRGSCYAVLEKLKLTDFGNRIPQISALIEANGSLTVANAIGTLVERSGLSASDYDVSELSSQNLRGYTLTGPQGMAKAIEPILMAYDITVRESGGQLVFIDRGSEDVVTVDGDDLAAHQFGQNTPEALTITDITGIDLPSEVNVRFYDIDNEHQKGSQRERRINVITQSVLEVDLPLVLQADEGREVAARMLYEPWGERQSFDPILPPSYIDIEETDELRISRAGEVYKVTVTEVNRGANFVHEIKAVSKDRVLTDWNMPFDDTSGDDDEIYTPPDTTALVLDIPALRSGDETEPLVYAAVCATNPSAQWAGAALYRSKSGSSTQEKMTDLPVEATIGEALTALPDAPTHYWDYASTVDVEIYEGSLSSVTEAECLDGQNRMWIGNELVGFMDAELLDTRQYRLSNLLRGLRHTTDQTGTHEAGELCLLLEDGPMEAVPVGLAQLGITHNWRAVASEGDVDDWPINAVTTFEANSIRPFSPAHVAGQKESGGEFEVTWVRRSRAIGRVFGPDATPMLEASEEYEIDVLDAPGGSVVNTYTVTTNAWTYSTANQTTDFGSEQTSVTIRVRQMDSTIQGFNSDEVTLS